MNPLAVTVDPQTLEVSLDPPDLAVRVPQPGITVRESPPAQEVLVLPVVGPEGPQGERGADGTGAPYVFTQSSPSAAWHIVHGRGTQPSVVVRRADGLTISGFGSAYSVDANTVDLYFGQPIAGIATLNF